MATRQMHSGTGRGRRDVGSYSGRDTYYRRSGVNPYINGSAARELEEEIPQRRPEPQRRRQPRPQPQQRPVQLPSISGAAFLFLVAALGITVIISFSYLKNQSSVTQMQKQVVALQKEISETAVQNQEMKRKVEQSVDLSEVYDIATDRLGMVQAVNNQIFTYKCKKSDMVKQYADIPTAK